MALPVIYRSARTNKNPRQSTYQAKLIIAQVEDVRIDASIHPDYTDMTILRSLVSLCLALSLPALSLVP